MRQTTILVAGLTAVAALVVAALTLAPTRGETKPDPSREVFAAESSFAATMAARDLKAFAQFVDEEAIFFGRRGAIRGRDSIVAVWTPYFKGPAAPFSWRPDLAEVLPSGTLALTSGPVYNPVGRIVGRFNSIWRFDKDGRWRVVFDRGSPVCDTTKTE